MFPQVLEARPGTRTGTDRLVLLMVWIMGEVIRMVIIAIMMRIAADPENDEHRLELMSTAGARNVDRHHILHIVISTLLLSEFLYWYNSITVN